MARSLQQLLSEANDFELCSGLYQLIVEFHGEALDISCVGEEERIVILVFHASGIIENGGFRYLFERNLPGDPDYALTAAAFRATGCERAADAVDRTLAMFPHSRPPVNRDDRLRYYLQRIPGTPTELDKQFFRAKEDLVRCLAKRIRSRVRAFGHLHGSNPNASPPPTQTPPIRNHRPPGPTPDELPKWARVAFAARCARQVFPLLGQHWPEIASKRSDAVWLTIEFAEQSAADGKEVEGLRQAIMNAVVTAGAALMPALDASEPGPPNAYSGTIASFVAKTAEKAGECARTEGRESRLASLSAWDFAMSAAANAEREDIAEDLIADLRKLLRTAARGKWKDKTRVPAEIWTML